MAIYDSYILNTECGIIVSYICLAVDPHLCTGIMLGQIWVTTRGQFQYEDHLSSYKNKYGLTTTFSLYLVGRRRIETTNRDSFQYR